MLLPGSSSLQLTKTSSMEARCGKSLMLQRVSSTPGMTHQHTFTTHHSLHQLRLKPSQLLTLRMLVACSMLVTLSPLITFHLLVKSLRAPQLPGILKREASMLKISIPMVLAEVMMKSWPVELLQMSDLSTRW